MSQTLPERRSATEPQRWEPLSELEQMTQRMRRMLDQTFGELGGSSPLLTEGAGWSPFVDIEEQDDVYELDVELPGVKCDDVNIEVIGNELSITGEIKEKERKGAIRRRTRRTGRFEYRVRLPDQVDASKIEGASIRASSPSAFRRPSAPSARRSRSRRSEARALRLPVALPGTSVSKRRRVEMAVEHLCQRHGRPAVASRVRLRPDGTQETEHLWDTVELRRSTTFKCAGSAAAPVKTATTDENTVVLLADFYRAGDESVTAQMIVSADDAASDIAWIQNAWIQGAGCASGIANFSS